MSNVNALASLNAGPSSVNSGNHTCDNCPDGAPSFASVLETIEDMDALLTEQQKQLAEDLTTAQPGPNGKIVSLPPSALISLAANEYVSLEQQLTVSNPETGVDPAIMANTVLDEAPDSDLEAKTTEPLASEEPLSTQNGDSDLSIADKSSAIPQPVAGALELSLSGNKIAPVPTGGLDGNDQIPAVTGADLNPSDLADGGRQIPADNDNTSSAQATGAAPGIIAGQNEFAPLVQTTAAQHSTTVPAMNQAAANGQSNALPVETIAATPEAGKTILNAMNTKIEPTDTRTSSPGELSSAIASGETADQQSSAKGDGTGTQQNDGQRPSSLMQRLQPLQQAAPLFQFQDNMVQNAGQTADLAAIAPGTMPAGEMMRATGVEGLTTTTSNPATPQVPLNNIAVHIAAQARAGNQKFNIRLDPPELGRIDIRLEISRDGQTLTHLAVEKPETLDLLRQDSKALERALQNAGLDSRNGSLSFSLREESQNRQQATGSDDDAQPAMNEHGDDENSPEAPVVERTVNVSSGLDISI